MSSVAFPDLGSKQPAIVEVPVISEAIRSRGVPLSAVTVARDFVFVSGIPPIDPATGELCGGDIITQCHVAMRAVKACLAAAGSSLEMVASVRVYASNAGHYEAINSAYQEYFSSHRPARTFIPVGSWPGNFDLEIECVALRGGA